MQQSAPKTRLIVGRDTSSRIHEAFKRLESYPPDAEVLVLSANQQAADEVARTAARSAGARFGLVRFTASRIASFLAAPGLARQGRAPASRFALEAIAARAAHQLTSEGGIEYFAPVADRPGLPAAVAATVEELRMNRVAPDDLRVLPRGGPDLAAFAQRIEHELDLSGLADRAAIFSAAIDAVRESNPPYPVGLPVIILDVPVRAGLEFEFLSALVKAAPEAMATAAYGDTRSIQMLESVLQCRPEAAGREPGVTSLTLLKQHLFEESTGTIRKLDETVTLSSWPGEARECVEIARAINAEAARGIGFDQMAVLLRSAAEYRPYLEEAFNRAGIPIYFASGTTRPDPSGRALLALLACAAEHLSARRFAEYLSLAQVPDPGEHSDKTEPVSPDHDLVPVPPDLEGSEPEVQAGPLAVEDPDALDRIGGSLRAPWRWERFIVEAAVIGGEDRWKRRLDGLESELSKRRAEVAEEDEARAAQLDRQLKDIASLRAFALPLIERLASLPSRATWGEWLDRIRELASAALRHPETVLAELMELLPASPVGPVDIDEVQLVLTPRLRDLRVRAARNRYGAVFVGHAELARGLSFEIVFVPGLAEKLFPRKIVEDPVLLDEQRRILGVPGLLNQSSRAALERLALRLAAGAARQRIYLSYPRIDLDQARPRVPSFYGLEALRAAEGILPGFEELAARAGASSIARLGWPAPERPEEAIDEAEYDLALLGPLLHASSDEHIGTASYLLSANPHLARALRMRARRWLKRWSYADGLVDPDELALEALAKHQMAARSFSPTALQNFAACPYRFFLQAIHRLEPREDPIAIEMLDPLTRGALFHDAQFAILSALRVQGMLPAVRKNFDAVLEVVDREVEVVAARYEEDLAPAIPRVWEDGIGHIRADLREWLRRAVESDDGWVPHRFELSFGIVDRDRTYADPASVPHSVPVIEGLHLRGSIDLVERHPSGRLRATDHKTGKARAQSGVVIGGGEVLQPVFYALASEKLLEEPVEGGRLYYCTADGGFEERVVPLNDEARESARTVVEIIGHALEVGFLPAAPEEHGCQWCNYRLVCGPHEEVRATLKPLDRLVHLNRLRELP